MRKLYASVLALCLLLSLAACSDSPAVNEPATEPQPSATEPAVSESTPTEPPEQAPMFSISLPIIREESKHTDGSVLFALNYQEISLILPDPDVAEKIIVHYLNALDTVYRDSENIRSAAEVAYQGPSGWAPYSCTNLYHIKRIDNNVLSLHGTYSSYSGAVHPTHITQSANYDLITGDHLTLDEILAESAGMDQIYQLLVAQLETVQGDKALYPDFSDIIKDTLSYGDFSNWYFNAEGLCFCFSPYEIAPYTSGVVEATIPYSQLQNVLHDAYFPMEWAYEGSIIAEPFENADMDRFTQISELTLDTEAQQLLLHSGNTAVSNVIIEHGVFSPEKSNQFESTATVFACATLTPGDAVVLNVMLNDTSPVLRVSYLSGSQTIVKYISQNSENGSINLVGE